MTTRLNDDDNAEKELLIPVLLTVAGCGWRRILLCWAAQGAEESAARRQAAQKVQYTCPMHPFIIKDTPGIMPDLRHAARSRK